MSHTQRPRSAIADDLHRYISAGGRLKHAGSGFDELRVTAQDVSTILWRRSAFPFDKLRVTPAERLNFTKKGLHAAVPLEPLISKGLPPSGTLAAGFVSARRLDSMGLAPLGGGKRPSVSLHDELCCTESCGNSGDNCLSPVVIVSPGQKARWATGFRAPARPALRDWSHSQSHPAWQLRARKLLRVAATVSLAILSSSSSGYTAENLRHNPLRVLRDFVYFGTSCTPGVRVRHEVD